MAKIHYQIHVLASFLILLILFTQPILLPSIVSHKNGFFQASPSQNLKQAYQEQPIQIPGPDLAITNWTHNHIINPGFEDWSLFDPVEWDVQHNTDRYNWFATQPPWQVSQGTYAAGMQTRPSADVLGSTQIYQTNVDTDMRNLTLTFDYYAESFPSLDFDIFHLWIGLSDRRSINYHIVGAEGYSYSNVTFTGTYNLFGSAGIWESINRNITRDYLALPYFPTNISSGLVIDRIRFRILATTTSTQWLRVFFDDVQLQNETTIFIGGSIQDGDFESGAFNSWFHSGNFDASYVTRCLTAQSGVNSCNVTVASNGNVSSAHLSQEPCIRVTNQNQGIISLWWHLTQNNVSMNDFSMVQFQFYNFSGYFTVSYLLSYGDTFPYGNSSLNQFIHAKNFNTTGSWQKFQCNPWQDLFAIFHTPDAILNGIFVNVTTSGVNARVELLVDDVRFDARAVCDADYEDQNDIGSPILGWNRDYSMNFTVTSIGAGKGANCSLGSMGQVSLYHDLNHRPLNSSRETYFDVIWGINKFTTGLIELSITLNDSRTLHYVFASANWTKIPGAGNAYFNVTNAGTTGSWFQTHRDLVHDYQSAFGSLPNTTMLSLRLYSYTEGDPFEILFDELYIYDDPAPRLSNYDSWRAGLSESRKIFVDAEDQDLETVSVMFRANGGNWIELVMLPSTYYPYIDNRYETTTPERPYNTLVEYYLQARDSWGGISQLLNGSGYFYYRVQDTHVPEVEILWPSHETIVHGLVEIRVNATDTESGVDYVEFRIDGESHYNDTTAPYSYTWNSTTVPDGRHRFSAIAHDHRGNSAGRSRYVYIINNPDPPPPPFPFAIIAISMLVICTQITLLGYLLYRRKQKKGMK